MQPPCMEDDGAILGRRKRRCRVSFGTSVRLTTDHMGNREADTLKKLS